MHWHCFSFFISNSFNLTGGMIGANLKINYSFILGLIFLMLSFVSFTLHRKLDAILIPTGGSYETDIERTDRAAKEYLTGNEGTKYLIISGTLGGKKLSKSQRANIYRLLRQYRIKPKEIRIEGESKNSLENLLNSIKRAKKLGVKSIGIASNPSHLDRYEDILKAAKKEGIADKNFKIYRLETNESFADRFYGAISRLFYRYKLSKGIEEAKKRETPHGVKFVANFFYRFFKK